MPTAGEKGQALWMLMTGQDGELLSPLPLLTYYQKTAVSTGQPPLGYDTDRDSL